MPLNCQSRSQQPWGFSRTHVLAMGWSPNYFLLQVLLRCYHGQYVYHYHDISLVSTFFQYFCLKCSPSRPEVVMEMGIYRQALRACQLAASEAQIAATPQAAKMTSLFQVAPKRLTTDHMGYSQRFSGFFVVYLVLQYLWLEPSFES